MMLLRPDPVVDDTAIDGAPSREIRPAALAIRAFNVETAAIKDTIRGNVTPGKMRMQWWKDSIAGKIEYANHVPDVARGVFAFS